MLTTDILFTGFYGQLNSGDDAFVEVAAWGAAHYWGKSNNRFFAVQRKLPKTRIPTKGYPLSIPKSYTAQRRILLKNTNYLISAGGSTLHSEFSSSDPKRLAAEDKAQGGNLKLGAIGVSVGPFKSLGDERFIREYIKQLDFISLRDRRSFEFVRSIDNLSCDPVHAFDLAALLPKIYNYNIVGGTSEKIIIGISVCRYESIGNHKNIENERRRNKQIIELIKYIDRKIEVEFRFYIINGHPSIGDKDMTNAVIAASKPKNLSIANYNRNTEDVWRDINSCHAVISTRLHGAIFACFGNTPFMLVEYHQKCADFLTDVGYYENYRLYDAEFEIRNTGDTVISWCQDKNNYRFPSHLEKMINKAELNFLNILPEHI